MLTEYICQFPHYGLTRALAAQMPFGILVLGRKWQMNFNYY